ncbi:MAG TPA: dioxygenase, partial [Rhodoglobus sp.]|nr:dioxygenase [Rhodoglobus sp.]
MSVPAMPALFLSHGAPPLADDARWTRELAQWSAELPRPKSILMVSAHWEAAPIALSSTTGAPLLYDFWGFPQRYYEVTY